ncbi:MAG TPA: glycoside hydrolase 100 family protein [Steroidobacteraceae bacterium]|nr:glycoside hydrolase 100 family protein [Steroidobacteraceae bacterium]
MTKRPSERPDDPTLLQACHARSIELLKRNLTDGGILAATPGERAEKRGYTAIFGRDAAVCAIGMAVSGDKQLEQAAVTGLHTLASHQAPNGQIAKFVDLHRQEADFWYLGCIDSTLWWLIALAILDRREQPRGLLRRYSKRIKLAIQWLLAQEHQRFFLLQQNEASDWADIMPRSGFVLYTNALWYFVKLLFGVAHARETHENFNGLFHPFSARLAEYRRARLLNEYVLKNGRDRDLYLSFVNFSFWGDEGDVFGNVLAVLMGLTDKRATRRTLDALTKAHVGDPYPVRAVTHPIRQHSSLWRPYMARHRQNHVWQYHNGGIWPMVGGFWVAALAADGRGEQAQRDLVGMARSCAVRDWAFTEWLHGKTLAPRGMPGQSWNAAAFLMAEYAVAGGGKLLAP